jgi:hypothetical protein
MPQAFSQRPLKKRYLGGIGANRDFITSMLAEQDAKDRAARSQAAFLANVPNPMGQSIENVAPTRVGGLQDWARRKLESTGLVSPGHANQLAKKVAGLGGMAGLQALDEATYGHPGSALEMTVGGPEMAVLHGMPNLFRKPALEDLAKGVDPAKVWHDWQWELNAKGQPWTETTGAPRMNPDVEQYGTPGTGAKLPPRTSDFPPPEPVDPNQLRLPFDPSEEGGGRITRGQIPTRYDYQPYTMPTPRVPEKHGRPPATVSSFVSNPQLYEQPGLEFLGGIPMRLTEYPLPTSPSAGGLYYPPGGLGKGRIEVTTANRGGGSPVGTVQHELTHAAAQEFGLPQGYNWADKDAAARGAEIRKQITGDKQAFDDAFNKRTADYWRHEDEMLAKHGDYKPEDWDERAQRYNPRPGEMSLWEFKQQWGKDHPDLQKILNENAHVSELLERSDPNLAYHTSMGEVSARNAAFRDTGGRTPQALRAQRPELTEDVPRRYQWTTDQPPGTVIKPEPAASVEEPKGLGAPAIIRGKGSGLGTSGLTVNSPLSKVVLKTPIEHMEKTTLPFGKMVPENPLHPEWLLGKTVVPMRGDPAAAGLTLTGLGGRKFETSVDLHGGEGYPRMEENIRKGLGWASQPSAAATQANRAADIFRKTGEDVVGVYQKMGERSTAFNTMLSDTLHQMYKLDRSRIADADVAEFDRIMREVPLVVDKKTGKADFPAYSDWPGLDKLTPEYIRRGSGPKGDGKVRNKMFKLMDSKRWQDRGFPNTGYANWATTDARLLDVPTHTLGGATVTYDPLGRTVDQSGHPTYSRGIVARQEGVMPDIPLDVMAPEYRQTGGMGGGPIPNQYLEKFLLTRPPIIKMTGERLDRVMKYLRSQDGAKWGLGGAVTAGLLSQEQADQIKKGASGG